MSPRTQPKKERRNSDSVPLTSYLLHVGALVRVTPRGRDALICELTRPYSEVTGTFGVRPLGWPRDLDLRLDAVEDVRMPTNAGEALAYRELVEIKARQRAAFEAEFGRKQMQPPTPRGGCDGV